MSGIRIFYQSYVDEAHAGPYWPALRRHLDAVSDPGTQVEVHGITPYDSHPHPIMEWRCAREMIANAIRAEREDYDAIIVGHFQDAGMMEAKASVDIPVLGLGETSMLNACMLGQRMGFVTFKPAYIPWFRNQIARYGLKDRVEAIHAASSDGRLYAAAFDDPEARGRYYGWFTDECRPLVQRGCEVIIPTGGGPMTLLSGLKSIDGARVLDGVALCVKMAEAYVKLRRLTGLTASRSGEFALPPREVVEEFLTHPRGL